jgi:hypothetical protein
LSGSLLHPQEKSVPRSPSPRIEPHKGMSGIARTFLKTVGNRIRACVQKTVCIFLISNRTLGVYVIEERAPFSRECLGLIVAALLTSPPRQLRVVPIPKPYVRVAVRLRVGLQLLKAPLPFCVAVRGQTKGPCLYPLLRRFLLRATTLEAARRDSQVYTDDVSPVLLSCWSRGMILAAQLTLKYKH